jgi:ankyrin repeat protein
MRESGCRLWSSAGWWARREKIHCPIFSSLSKPKLAAKRGHVSLVIIAGWTLLVAEVVVVASMFVLRDAGDDAAGRGVGRALSLLAGLALLVAGSLFVWGQRGGPRAMLWAGLVLMALPLVVVARNAASAGFRRIDLATGHARHRAFADAHLTRVARAIEAEDIDAVRALLAEGAVDFDARNRGGQTILGVAVAHALARMATPAAAESVRLLLAAGAGPAPNVIRHDPIAAEPDAHLLVAHVFDSNAPNALSVLDLLLGAGADANARDHAGQPLYFAPFLTRPKVDVLARHGADFSALDTREDRTGWTAAMVAAQLGNEDLVRFFLDHGVRADHVAPDGMTLAKIVARKP